MTNTSLEFQLKISHIERDEILNAGVHEAWLVLELVRWGHAVLCDINLDDSLNLTGQRLQTSTSSLLQVS